jgi:hypothetical protein
MGHQRFHGIPQRQLLAPRNIAQRLNRSLAYPPRRKIQHAQKRNVVLRMQRQSHVRQCIFHLAAIVKAEPSHQVVANPSAAQHLFERTGLKIRSVLHCTSLIRILTEDSIELPGNEFCFRLRIAGFIVAKIRPLFFFRAKCLSQPIGIVGNHRCRCVQDRLR